VYNSDELDEQKKKRLDEALDKCPELTLCHYVKEEFRDILKKRMILKRLQKDWKNG
jgi:hypothetical protein